MLFLLLIPFVRAWYSCRGMQWLLLLLLRFLRLLILVILDALRDHSSLVLDVLLFLLVVRWLLHTILGLLVIVNIFLRVVVSPSHRFWRLILDITIKLSSVSGAFVAFIWLGERLVGHRLDIFVLSACVYVRMVRSIESLFLMVLVINIAVNNYVSLSVLSLIVRF
jgi:hypothetical protein